MQSGAQNAVMGDQDSPVNLPETELPDEVMKAEQQMASYAVHPEYLRLKEFLEGRKTFFSMHLPDGRRVADASKDERDAYWVAACVITGLIDDILLSYDRAREAVKNAGRQD